MLIKQLRGLMAACIVMVCMLACGSEDMEERVGEVSAATGSVGTAAGFEDDDGSLTPQAPTNFDWNSFAPTTWTGAAPYRTSDKIVAGWTFKGIEDDQGTNSDSAFAGGVKQDDNCAKVNMAKAPNKDDLKRIYLASRMGNNGHTYLDLAWVRIPQNTTSPSAHIGFEFNQGDTPCGPDSDGLVQRTPGDMLIVYDFEGGSADAPKITLRRWVISGTCEVGSNSPPCWGPASDLTASGFADAKVNTSTVGPVTNQIAPSPPETLGVNEFGEAGIDLTDAGVFPSGQCVSFGTAFGVSRSSGNSGTAQMKDLVGPADFTLSNCGTINIIKQTSPPGVTQTFDFTSNAPGHSSFTLNAGGPPGNTEVMTNVLQGSYAVVEGLGTPGFMLQSIDCISTAGSSTSTDVTTGTANIQLAAGSVVTCTYTNAQQLGAIKITKTSSKPVNPPLTLPGATFSIVKSDGSSVSVITGADGTVCVDGLAFGDYIVTETGPPVGYAIDDGSPHTVHVVANSTCGDGNEATHVATDSPLTDLTCTATSQVVNGTKSRIVCVDANDVCVASSDPLCDINATGLINPATASVTGLKPGNYVCYVVVDP